MDPGNESSPRRHLDTVQWELTRRCEQLCKLCFIADDDRASGQLSTGECMRIVNELAAMDVKHVHLFGGEAHLRSDFLEIVEAIAARGINIALTSGSPRLPIDDVVRAAGDRLSHVMLSIDGLETTHDELRNSVGSFAGILGCLDRVRALGIPCGISTQVNRCNLSELETLTKLLFMMGIHLWHAQLTEPFGRARSHLEMVLQPYELPEAVDTLVRIKNEATRQGVPVKLGNNIGYNTERIRALRSDTTSVDSTGCQQGLSYLAIEAGGGVKGCASCESGIGTRRSNVKRLSLREIWECNAEFDWTRNRSEKRLWGFCGECVHARSCHGGCVQSSQALFGKPGNNPYCEYRVLELAAKGIRERIELDEQMGLRVIEESVPAANGAQS